MAADCYRSGEILTAGYWVWAKRKLWGLLLAQNCAHYYCMEQVLRY